MKRERERERESDGRDEGEEGVEKKKPGDT